MRQPRKFTTRLQASAFNAGDWLATLRRYIGFVAVANLVWEIAHLPLYTIWETGTVLDLVFAALHCTGGDVLIALSAVMLRCLSRAAGIGQQQATRAWSSSRCFSVCRTRSSASG